MTNERKTLLLRLGVLALALLFLFVGWSRAEQLDVLRKAVNLCLECIGIG